MRRISPLPASVALAIVLLTGGAAPAQEVRIEGDAATRAKVAARELAARGEQRNRRLLANQLRPFYRYELMHARSACGLSREQIQEIRREADAAYERAIAGLLVAREARPNAHFDLDYQEAIRQAVDPVVERHVSRDQWAALQADRRLRAASRAEAGIDLLVAVIDRDLFLTGEQRRAIAASVAAHWEDRFLDPLEVAFNDESRCPKIPDELMSPYISAAQRDVWGRIPRLQGRLWGVTIDHGGDPATEQELGAPVVSDRPPVRVRSVPPSNRPVIGPRPADQAAAAERARLLEARVRAQQLRVAAEVRIARQPAPIARPAPPQEDEEGEGAQAAALARQRQLQAEQMRRLQAAYRSLFGRRVFGAQQDEAEARLEVETALAHRVDYLRLAGRLADGQWSKLRAAGRGDIKRFFDRFDAASEGMARSIDPQVLGRLLVEESRALALEWPALRKVEGPIFTRTLDRTLTDEHRAAIEREDRDRRVFRLRADVRWTTILLARSLGLKEDQRRRLESLLLERTVPPNRFEISDYVIVMFQASRIPEGEIRPIFDDLQWRVIAREFAAVGRYEIQLRRGKVFPAEMFGDEGNEPLPPIRLLAPPGNPARR